jgi:phosphopantetheinyl transferase
MTPTIRILDARELGLDERGLRRRARTESSAQPSAHVSRSYCYPYAIIASHSEPVGVDIERHTPCDAAFGASICTPAERSEWAAVDDPDAFFTEVWSSKEALSKALGDAVAYDPQRLASPIGWAEGRSGRWRAVQLKVAPQHAGWVCWRA